jgi:hypothetical protein
VLQQRIDEVSRAAETIDNDPEAAAAKLAPSMSNNGQVPTPQDTFALLAQMMAAQQAMQQQIIQLQAGQRQQDTVRTVAHTNADIERSARRQKATLDAWKTEPREPVFLEPTHDERKAAEVHNGEFPPRLFRVNGVGFPVRVNEIVSVPASIAALVRHTQGASRHRGRPAQAVQTIADPEAGMFLAGAQSITAGHDGKVGEGPILVPQLPQRQDDAQPLDVRYDAFGR